MGCDRFFSDRRLPWYSVVVRRGSTLAVGQLESPDDVIDHFNLPVSDLKQSRAFYSAILEPLEYQFILQDGAAIGFGQDSWRFGLIEMPLPFPALHVAFEAPSRDSVSRFYDAALRAGGRPNGTPGIRTEYDPNYFSAFVLDPDGHNVEAVCRIPE